MKLKSFGCSFIFGTDLHDNNFPGLTCKARYSRFTWPALLAKDNNWDYNCYAQPGSGNLQILERLLSQLTDTEPAVYVVGWTWIDRFDYTTQDTPFQWQTIMPVDTTHVAEVYYRDIHSEYRDKLTTLINIKTAIDALKASGNKFIMTYMDELIFETQWHTSPAVSALQGYCKPYMIQFNNKNFLEYSKENGFEISQTQHPLEAAHLSAAELIKSYNLV